MLRNYEKAFGLRENPFKPSRIEGVEKIVMTKDLHTSPLKIHEEPKLISMYCPHAGPFHSLFEKFKNMITLEGYEINPSCAGNSCFIFLIMGSEGTGKTTLASMMMHHLKQCKEKKEWIVHDPWAEKIFNSSIDQMAEIDKMERWIKDKTNANDYCCLLIDNLIYGAEARVFDLYDKFGDRIMFLFLITSDPKLYEHFSLNSRHQVITLQTRPLTADDAVAFVKCRIETFRKTGLLFTSDFGLFPFDADDIRNAVMSGVIKDKRGTITLRMLGVLLHKCIIYRMQELDENFDISTMSNNDVKNNIIHVIEYYNKIVQK